MADEPRVALTAEQNAAMIRCFRSDDFIIGVEPWLRGMQGIINARLQSSDFEKDLYRAQGEFARLRIILDFAKMRRMNVGTETER